MIELLKEKNMDLNKIQKTICEKSGAEYFESPFSLTVGISRNVKEGVLPLNGVRYKPESDTSGWYIWAGEVFSEHPDFFLPLHISHLGEWNGLILKYLGLPPGWRFLVTEDYEDVWFDEQVAG
jgi:hypothetical protein